MSAFRQDTPIVLFASGKGGVGKSTLAAALCTLMARQGKRVLLIDGDVGLRSQDLMLRMQDKVLYELVDCLNRQCSLDEAIVPVPSMPGLYLLAAGQEARPRAFEGKSLDRIFRTLKQRFDFILIDGPAGLGRSLRNWTMQATRIVLIATADDVCLRDTEKAARMMIQGYKLRPQLLINRVDHKLIKRGLLSAPEAIAQMLDLELLGVVPQSDAVYRAMLEGATAADTNDRPLRQALERTSMRLMGALAPWRGPETAAQKLRRLLTGEVRHV